MTTVRQIIEASMRIIGELGEGQSMTAEQGQDALQSLIDMVASWSVEPSLIYTETVESFTLTAGDGSYTIGSGGDFNTSRPIAINTARIKDGSLFIQDIEIVGKDTYSEEDDGLTTGTPEYLWYDANALLGTIRLFPYPSQAYIMEIYSHKAFVGASLALSDTLVLPEGYMRAIKYNLAREIAPEYGKSLTPDSSRIARESMNIVKKRNLSQNVSTLKCDDALTTKNNSFNVETRQ